MNQHFFWGKPFVSLCAVVQITVNIFLWIAKRKSSQLWFSAKLSLKGLNFAELNHFNDVIWHKAKAICESGTCANTHTHILLWKVCQAVNNIHCNFLYCTSKNWSMYYFVHITNLLFSISEFVHTKELLCNCLPFLWQNK